MLIAGNRHWNLSKALYALYPDAVFCSRTTGYDLTQNDGKDKFKELALSHNVIVIVSALSNFHQLVLYDTVYQYCLTNQHRPHIITVGSTIDRSANGNGRLYSTEKVALSEHTRNLNLHAFANNGPKTTHISFGMLETMRKKFPDKKFISADDAAGYIKWIIEQPSAVNINEVSIDPMQDDYWYRTKS